MAADYELPVFSLRHNWSQSLTERLEWLTDPLEAMASGAEQRRGLRLSPRRTLEPYFTPQRNERSWLDLMLHRLGSSEWMVPLWHDRGVLGAAAVTGATSLTVDTVNREFLADGMALLVGPSAMTCEAVRIDTLTSTTLTLHTGLLSNWPAGTVIHPLRRGRVSTDDIRLMTSRVASSRARFTLDALDDVDAGAWGDDGWTVDWSGVPLLVRQPNWREEIDIRLLWNAVTLDGDVGKIALVDTAGRAFPSQQHHWLLHGRSEQMAFRKMLHRLRGRLGSLWVPTFTQDMIVARAALSGATHLDIQNIGFGYAGGPAEGRERILISGDATALVSSMGSALVSSEERLMLSAGLSRAVAVGEMASFVDRMRLDQDAIEIEHHTDSDGAAESTLIFRAISPVRDGSADGHLSIPVAGMTAGRCGSVSPIIVGTTSSHAPFANGLGCTMPDVDAGDIAIFHVHHPDAGSFAYPTLSGPAGFTLADTVNLHALNYSTAALYWRRCDGTEGGSGVFYSASSGSGTAIALCTLTVYKDCIATGVPFEALAHASGYAPTITGSDITTTGDRETILTLFGVEDFDNTSSPSPGWTELLHVGTTTANNGTVIIDEYPQDTPATVLGETRIVGGGVLGGGMGFISFTLALIPRA